MNKINGIYPYKSNSWISRKKIKKLLKGSKNNNNLNVRDNFSLVYEDLDADISKQKKFNYCDITGYQTSNKERLSQLYYLDSKIYKFLKHLNSNIKDEFRYIKEGSLL